MADVESLLYSSDEEPLSKIDNGKSLTNWNCINPECPSNAERNDMITADTFSHFYYGVDKLQNRKRKICSQCKTAVVEKQNSCVEKIRNRESIFQEELKAAKSKFNRFRELFRSFVYEAILDLIFSSST